MLNSTTSMTQNSDTVSTIFSGDNKENATEAFSVDPKTASTKTLVPHHFPGGATFSVQGYRTLRRLQLIRRGLILRQFERGRGNPSAVWCNQDTCEEEYIIFTNPFSYPVNQSRSREGVRVMVYFQDFADAMVTRLFAIQDNEAKKHKSRGLLSFIDSPPVRAAFLWFIRHYQRRSFKLSDKELREAFVMAQADFLDIMFGIKTKTRADKAHSYLIPEPEVIKKWTPCQFILSFLIRCEIWRQQETAHPGDWRQQKTYRQKIPRSKSWRVGSSGAVAQFLAAILLNYTLMWQEACFAIQKTHKSHAWDQVWETWLREYPPQDLDEDINVGFFQQWDQVEKTEEEVFKEGGYLGGFGQCDDIYKPGKWYLGKLEDCLMR
ncbi:hypothetical protein F53441_3459 [Fusarium austroafricanum]|uniref:Uncharacterized protein n=1 Tax=Fusarium austroafricanum TaxID=2364996 RepID=A0A8H4KQM4_9HYPO|nr:hypothetical protein F53441_3459 [Fusarium austroafricanum]